MIIIQQISDSQLLQVYTNNCRAIEIARRCGKITATDGESVSLEQLQLDQDHIMREVNNRLSFAYKWEIDQIKQPPASNKGIKPGNVYKHNRMAIVHIVVVEDEYTQYSCRLYVSNFYLCRVMLKQNTILDHFTRLS